MNPYATGADKSPKDVRTFSYIPTGAHVKGGTRYTPEDIESQYNVGICTAISLTQNAHKALGKNFSAEFQYLCQKKFYDGNWDEGSSIFSAVKVAKNIGLLPRGDWTFTTEEDRKLPYQVYIAKLQNVPAAEIERLKAIAAAYKIKAYASVPVDRDLMAAAIDESKAGILSRYDVGREWWTAPIEPLRAPGIIVSGHAITDSNYDGSSFRVANTWGTDWADKGTAYRIQTAYKPTECWMVYYNDVPAPIQDQIESRSSIIGKIMDLLQQVIALLAKLK